MNDQELDRLTATAIAKLPAGAYSIEPNASPQRRGVLLNVYAEALRKGGEWDTAAAIYRFAINRPDTSHWAWPGLARLSTQRGVYQDAADAWGEALARFPDRAKVAWYEGLADAFAKLGEDDKAAKARAEMAEKFPTAISSLMFRAREAERAEDWTAALSFWTNCHEAPNEKPRPVFWFGRAQALLWLGQPDAALALWREAQALFPDNMHTHIRLLAGARELGLAATVEACATHLIENFSAQARPEWFAEKARALLILRREAEARDVSAALSAKFPESELSAILEIEFGNRLFYGLQKMLRISRRWLQKFPGNRMVRAEHARNLLAAGDDAAADIIAGLMVEQDDHIGMISQWQLIMDRDGTAEIKDLARDAISTRCWTLAAGLSLSGFLLSILRPWAADLALELCEDLARRFPGRNTVTVQRANALIRLRRNDEALALIEAIPAPYVVAAVLELRAWAAARRGAVGLAREIWQDIFAVTHNASVHGVDPNFELLRLPSGLEDYRGVTVFFAILNEAARLPEFLRHYRQLGVRRFIGIDNVSTDDGPALLAAQPDVILYRTPDSFRLARSAMRWKQELIDRHANGSWCLSVDADEAFIYPGWETLPIDDFTAYLDQNGDEAVPAYMLDVYPDCLFSSDGSVALHADYIYYDSLYEWLGIVRPPFLEPVGGIRQRLFGAEEMLHKVPLFKASCGATINSHETTPMRFAAVTGALLHYKLLGLTETYLSEPPETRQMAHTNDRSAETMRRHQRYEAKFAGLQDKDLRQLGLTQNLTDSLVMADRGVFHAPAEFRAWYAARNNPALASGNRPG